LRNGATIVAVSTVTVAVWPDGKMPGYGATEPEGALPSRGDNVQRITNISRPTLTMFPAPRPVGSSTAGKDVPAPAIIICPGGAFNYVVYDKEGTEIASWLNTAGITGLVLKYRTPSNREGALQDIQRSLSLVRSHATQWHIDPKRLGIIGFSSGAYLSAQSSTGFEKRSYPAIDAVDQQSCRPDFAVLVYPSGLARDGKVAPDLNIKANVPPTLLVHSEDDRKFVAGSKIYQAALDSVKVPNQFLLYSTGGHGYGLRCTKEARAWPPAALAWLQNRHSIGPHISSFQ
jgi:acetyl esterase/lipase